MTDKEKLDMLLAHQKRMTEIAMIQDAEERKTAYKEMPDLPFSGEEVMRLMMLLNNNDIIEES